MGGSFYDDEAIDALKPTRTWLQPQYAARLAGVILTLNLSAISVKVCELGAMTIPVFTWLFLIFYAIFEVVCMKLLYPERIAWLIARFRCFRHGHDMPPAEETGEFIATPTTQCSAYRQPWTKEMVQAPCTRCGAKPPR